MKKQDWAIAIILVALIWWWRLHKGTVTSTVGNYDISCTPGIDVGCQGPVAHPLEVDILSQLYAQLKGIWTSPVYAPSILNAQGQRQRKDGSYPAYGDLDYNLNAKYTE